MVQPSPATPSSLRHPTARVPKEKPAITEPSMGAWMPHIPARRSVQVHHVETTDPERGRTARGRPSRGDPDVAVTTAGLASVPCTRMCALACVCMHDLHAMRVLPAPCVQVFMARACMCACVCHVFPACVCPHADASVCACDERRSEARRGEARQGVAWRGVLACVYAR